uniref:Uncharacterized protein n=1 Tax=Anguilla anguilla TaxID=7936 RepID=A0A0E9TQR8_ANGAN
MCMTDCKEQWKKTLSQVLADKLDARTPTD